MAAINQVAGWKGRDAARRDAVRREEVRGGARRKKTSAARNAVSAATWPPGSLPPLPSRCFVSQALPFSPSREPPPALFAPFSSLTVTNLKPTLLTLATSAYPNNPDPSASSSSASSSSSSSFGSVRFVFLGRCTRLWARARAPDPTPNGPVPREFRFVRVHRK